MSSSLAPAPIASPASYASTAGRLPPCRESPVKTPVRKTPLEPAASPQSPCGLPPSHPMYGKGFLSVQPQSGAKLKHDADGSSTRAAYLSTRRLSGEWKWRKLSASAVPFTEAPMVEPTGVKRKPAVILAADAMVVPTKNSIRPRFQGASRGGQRRANGNVTITAVRRKSRIFRGGRSFW